MDQKRELTRREFLRVSAVVTAGVAVAACAKTEEVMPTATPRPEEKPKEEAKVTPPKPVEEAAAKEAPMLAELVKAGKLPPAEERLPQNPWVAPMAESVGNYGGTIHRGFKGVSDRWGPTKHIDRCLAWYDRNLTVQPRIVESWETNEDASEWTWHLRKGMKWSDGADFTSDDFMWWYEYDLLNTDLNPTPDLNWCTGSPKVVMEMECPDQYTVKMKFADPNPLFAYKVGRHINAIFIPGHHMKQFHIELTDDKDALEAAVEEAGFGSWDEYYDDRNWWYMNAERPMVSGWLAKNALSEELFLMERNPYFFGVDPDGNQLPYLDTVTHRLFESTEVFNLWIVNGEIDFQSRHVGIANYSLFKENEEKGDYKVFLAVRAEHVAMQPNHTTKNERLREFFNDRKVRIALSLAANREEMNDLIYDGLLTPRQYSPLSMSPNAYPKQANAYIEYDPDRANELLDEAGYTEKDAEGFRLWKDGSGETLSFVIEGTAEPGSPGEDEVQMVVKYFADVGIKAAYKYFERSLYEEHWGANEIEAAWWGGDRTVVPLAPGAPIFLGTMVDRPWACAWGHWKNDPTNPVAEEPPADHWIRDIWDIWDKVTVEPDPEKQNELFRQILDIWAEELPMIGFLGESPIPVIVKNGFRNYLEGMPMDDTTGDEHLLNTETYFWEEPEKHT